MTVLGPWLALAACSVVVFAIWVRRAQRARRRWVSSLGLRGVWGLARISGQERGNDQGLDTHALGRVELLGRVDEGRYRLQLSSHADWREHWDGPTQVEQGRWDLQGSTLTLRAQTGNLRHFRLRRLSPQRLGLSRLGTPDAPGHFVLSRETSNVVELPQRAQRR